MPQPCRAAVFVAPPRCRSDSTHLQSRRLLHRGLSRAPVYASLPLWPRVGTEEAPRVGSDCRQPPAGHGRAHVRCRGRVRAAGADAPLPPDRTAAAGAGALVAALPGRVWAESGCCPVADGPRRQRPARAPAAAGRSTAHRQGGDGEPLRADRWRRLRRGVRRRRGDLAAQRAGSGTVARIPPDRVVLRRQLGRALPGHQRDRHLRGRAQRARRAPRRALPGTAPAAVVQRCANPRPARAIAGGAGCVHAGRARHQAGTAPHQRVGAHVGGTDRAFVFPGAVPACVDPALPQPPGVRRPAARGADGDRCRRLRAGRQRSGAGTARQGRSQPAGRARHFAGDAAGLRHRGAACAQCCQHALVDPLCLPRTPLLRPGAAAAPQRVCWRRARHSRRRGRGGLRTRTRRLRSAHAPQPGQRAEAGRASRVDPAVRRHRHRQGGVRQGGSPRLALGGAAVRGGELCGDPRGADRERTVRLRTRRVHRCCARRPPRQAAAGQRRHLIPGRDRRHAAAAADATAARARRTERDPAGQRPGDAAGTARDQRQPPRPGADGGRRRIPRGPVLPPQRCGAAPAAATRTQRQGRADPHPAARGKQRAQRAHQRRCAAQAAQLRLAG